MLIKDGILEGVKQNFNDFYKISVFSILFLKSCPFIDFVDNRQIGIIVICLRQSGLRQIEKY